MVKENEFTYETYPTGSVHIDEGWYTRKELQTLLDYFDELSRRNEKAMEQMMRVKE